jgi:undecaprenyl-diphosphatase
MLFGVPSQIGYTLLGALVLGESAGLPIPGETALLVAGGLAAAGHLQLPLVIAIAAAAAITGDTLGYWLGRRGGRRFLLRDGFLAGHRRRAVGRADRFFARHGPATVFVGRWIPGLRYMAALMAGATHMPWRRFAVANALGALAWAVVVATLATVVGPAGTFAFSATGLAVAGAALAVARLRRRPLLPE